MQQMLLYIENKLSPSEMESYSAFLQENPEEMQKVLQITQALALYDVNNSPIHRIDIVENPATSLEFILEGVVRFFKKRELAFRGQSSVTLYRFEFLDTAFEIIQKDPTSVELLVSEGSGLEWLDLANRKNQIITSGDSVFVYRDETYLIRYQNQYLFISY
ncbi:MAG: hypothetical protein ACRCS8_03960 [Brevinema sp.]